MTGRTMASSPPSLRAGPLALLLALAPACGDAPSTACTDGTVRTCYDGPAGTADVGLCKAGTQVCAGGSFGPCEGQVVPAAESCAGGFDEDCNGLVDDGMRVCARRKGFRRAVERRATVLRNIERL